MFPLSKTNELEFCAQNFTVELEDMINIQNKTHQPKYNK